jgi:hypothetical protein
MISETGLLVSRRKFEGFEAIHKFGQNPALSASAKESIWKHGGLYPWDSLTSAAVLHCSSSNVNDDGDLRIEGLDANFLPLVETISLNGTTDVVTTGLFIRMDRMIYQDGANAGNISAKIGAADGDTVSYIGIGDNQTLQAFYTVPANKVGYLVMYTAGSGKNDDATIDLYVKKFGDTSFLLQSQMDVYQNTSSNSFAVPIKLSPKTDVDFRAITSSANSKVTLNFDILLERL